MVVLWILDKHNIKRRPMKNPLIQGLIILIFFFGTWFALNQIDWVKLFKIQKVTEKTEKKLGDLFWEVFKKTEVEIKNPIILNSVDSMVSHICKANNIDINLLKIHILDKDEINAYALPDGHLVLYSGLISKSANEEELAGVISHEIAHIELSHVMKKLGKEIGFSVLISMTTGSGGAEIIKETAKMLSSSAFDRSLEKEADIKAVDYLINSNLDPKPFADFLYKLSEEKGNDIKYLTWISTHPDSKERSAYIIEYSRGKPINKKQILSNENWNKVKDELRK
jgi:beta-barrel assembly-enhancing protease